MLHKIVLKVIADNKLVWRYFCSVPEEIYEEFNTVCSNFDLNVYLAVWAKSDWGVSFNMSMVENIDKLKDLIKFSCKKSYPELYIYQSYDLVPDEDFWVKLWVSSHMKYETEKGKLE